MMKSGKNYVSFDNIILPGFFSFQKVASILSWILFHFSWHMQSKVARILFFILI